MIKEKIQPVFCEHCGASMKEYWHPLSSGYVSALIKFANGVREKRENKIHLLQDLWGPNQLSRHEWNNFTHLRFHGMVAKVKEKDDGGELRHIAGYWLLTRKGGAFLRGEISVPKKVKTFRNEVIDHSAELAHIKDFNLREVSFPADFDFDIHQGKLV